MTTQKNTTEKKLNISLTTKELNLILDSLKRLIFYKDGVFDFEKSKIELYFMIELLKNKKKQK